MSFAWQKTCTFLPKYADRCTLSLFVTCCFAIVCLITNKLRKCPLRFPKPSIGVRVSQEHHSFYWQLFIYQRFRILPKTESLETGRNQLKRKHTNPVNFLSTGFGLFGHQNSHLPDHYKCKWDLLHPKTTKHSR